MWLFYSDGRRGPSDIDVQGAARDTHHREHPSAERGRDQVFGGEALAAALIVLGGVGVESRSQRDSGLLGSASLPDIRIEWRPSCSFC